MFVVLNCISVFAWSYPDTSNLLLCWALCTQVLNWRTVERNIFFSIVPYKIWSAVPSRRKWALIKGWVGLLCQSIQACCCWNELSLPALRLNTSSQSPGTAHYSTEPLQSGRAARSSPSLQGWVFWAVTSLISLLRCSADKRLCHHSSCQFHITVPLSFPSWRETIPKTSHFFSL